MTETAILIENIGKEYKIGSSKSSLRESFSGLFSPKAEERKFWALKDVSVEIKRGEAIGIIGKNGAGKSTLLKILSRITKPTTGRFEAWGRVSSLLEVGTGFHPELTGRENVFLNGTMLGMSRVEVKRRFEEIVSFAGVEKFIDTPVKHYSSGMYVRLAFAVAAHLDPDILIIDEVLAVGDMAFQRKCLSNLDDVTKQGKTVLIVSHNHSQLKYLCSKGILLETGQVKFMGNINEAIGLYTGSTKKSLLIDTSQMPRAGHKHADFVIFRVEIKNLTRSDGIELVEGDEILIALSYEVKSPLKELLVGFSITDMLGSLLVECRSTATYPKVEKTLSGSYVAKAKIKLDLEAGNYTLNVGARSLNGFLEYIPGTTSIEIVPNRKYEEWNKPHAGMFHLNSEWEIQKL